VPLQTDDIGEEALGQAVLADDALCPPAAILGEGQGPPLALEESGPPQPSDHLGHGRSRVPQMFDQAGLDDGNALLLELVDRLQVLLDGRVEPTAFHTPILRRAGCRQPRGPGWAAVVPRPPAVA